MTANGDGLNFEFLNDSAPAKKPEPPTASGDSDGVLDDITLDVVDDGSSSSIFDEGPDNPVKSVDEIPDALPNISGGDTEILVRGRAEIHEFTEEFGAGPALESPAVGTAGNHAEEVVDLSSGLPEATGTPSAPAPPPVLHNPLGGLFFSKDRDADSPASPPAASSPSDTVVNEFSFPGRTSTPSESPPVQQPAEPIPPAVMDDTHVTTEPAEVSLDGFHDSGMSLSSVTSAVATTAPAKTVAKAAPASGGNRLLLIVMGGYALAVTALCVMLLSMLAKAREASQLESLPDLKPIPAGKVAIYKVNTDLPAGHTLKLGDHQRYGNLRVEPIKVTRSPIHFQHFSKSEDFKDYESAPVLKLWVKFTNESKEQAFVPLDADLMFRRHRDAQDVVRANHFLVQKRDKPRKDASLVFAYEQLQSSEWDMAGQQLGKVLQPGESLETYIPTTEEGIDRLQGDLLWRIHLRKGHSPGGYGVTTLVEVAFSAKQIQSDGT
jgi:hypothetical protein